MNKKEFLILSVTIFITLIVWIGADIYHEFLTGARSKDVPPAPNIKDYKLDQFEKTLRILKTKQE